MSLILVDSSVWIDYFRGSNHIKIHDFENLIDNNQICINDLILSELIPSLHLYTIDKHFVLMKKFHKFLLF